MQRKAKGFNLHCRAAAYFGEAKVVQGERNAKKSRRIYLYSVQKHVQKHRKSTAKVPQVPLEEVIDCASESKQSMPGYALGLLFSINIRL